jgi:hypothetical protein
MLSTTVNYCRISQHYIPEDSVFEPQIQQKLYYPILTRDSEF